jgi:SAM-dependent methyltransferase
VLTYVPDKRAAVSEFHRVLKPGGRVSIAEPIFQDQALENCALGRMIQSQPAQPANHQTEFLKLLHRYRAAQYPSTEAEIWASPITNFSERDLVHLFREAGFTNVHLELLIDHKRPVSLSWEICLDISPHPWAPTLREILDTRFSSSERQLFERGLRQILESENPVTHEPVAYITAEKPAVTIRRSHGF